MLIRALLLMAAVVQGSFHPLPAQAQTPDAQRSEVRWNVERRDIPLSGWRHRLAVGQDGTVWIGENSFREEGGGLLYRKKGTTWSVHRIPSSELLRTFVLDIDPQGGLWVAPFHPEPDNRHPRSPYNNDLRIQRYDGQRWREEKAPGLWPQCIDMVTPEEGWIGGVIGRYDGKAWSHVRTAMFTLKGLDMVSPADGPSGPRAPGSAVP